MNYFYWTLYMKTLGLLKKINKVYFTLIGIGALIWFLIRVIPKPSRATYPCQRIAFPLASGLVIWISVNILSFLGLKKLYSYSLKSGKKISFILFCFGLTLYFGWLTLFPVQKSTASVKSEEVFEPSDSANNPMGIEKGIFPGRVIWAFDTSFTKWNITKGYWWDSLYTDQAVVSDMISRSIRKLSGKENDSLAWDAIFRYFNSQHGKGDIGYKTGEKIAIKLNLVQCTDPSNNGGNKNFTPPQTVLALLRQLVYYAGVDPADIVFYDIMRSVPTSITLRCKKEFPKVRFVGATKGTYQEKFVRDTVTIRWSEQLDLEINGGHSAYLPKIITEASYIINLANLKGHRYVGVTACSKNHFGSMSAYNDVNTPHLIGLHPYVAVHDYLIPTSSEWSFKGREMGTYNALVDLMGHKDLGEKTLLFVVDGLFSVSREGDSNSNVLKWQQEPFNNHFSSSLLLSQDNVAIESVVVDFLRAEQAVNSDFKQEFDDGTGYHKVVFGNVDNYLHEAALANNPPSGTYYSPNWEGTKLNSLGVHEHWNNNIDKQYSRNLGKDTGIELVQVTPTLPAPSNLSISTSNKNNARLMWENTVDDAKILIYKSIGSRTNFKHCATLDENSTEFLDTTLNSSTFYRLKYLKNEEYSTFSNEAKGVIVNTPLEVLEYSFLVFPNPSKDDISIEFQYPALGLAKATIKDLIGREIKMIELYKSENTFIKSINIRDLKSGIYNVEITFGNISISRVFIKR